MKNNRTRIAAIFIAAYITISVLITIISLIAKQHK